MLVSLLVYEGQPWYRVLAKGLQTVMLTMVKVFLV